MTFLNNMSAVAWGWALAVPLGILALYFLKLRRKPVEVPSTFLWKKSIEDLRVNSLWQRLRQSLLLLLQLLVAAAILFALLGPTWNVEQTGRRLILLIDQSASMSTREANQTRLDEAKSQARALVDQMKPGDAGMVVAFDRSARVLVSYTEDKMVLTRGIDSIQPTSERTDIREALSIAGALANPQRILEQQGDADVVPLELAAASGEAAKVFLLSDGRFPSEQDFSLGNLSLEYIRIGKETENLGIMELASRPRADGKLEVFARVQNLGQVPKETSIELRRGEERIDLRRVELLPQQSQGISFAAIEGVDEPLSLRLLPGDSFAVDDVAWLTVTPPRPARVLRVGGPNSVLDAVFATPAMQKVATFEKLPKEEKDRDFARLTEDGGYDLVIFDRCRPRVLPSCNTWFIGALPIDATEREPADAVKVSSASILHWEASHPALRFLQLDDVLIGEAVAVPASSQRTALMETDRGLVLWTQSRGVFTDMVLSFPLVDGQGNWQTDWPLKPSFPLFVLNTLRFLSGVDQDRGRNLLVGEPLVVRTEATSATVTHQKRSSTVRAVRPGWIEYIETNAPGAYRIVTDREKEWAAVNLFDESESTVAPREVVQVGAEKTAEGKTRFESPWRLWRGLVMLAFGILMLEWYIYNRRVYV